MMGIYKITNKINQHCYIGQSTDITRRWNQHRRVYSFPTYGHYPLYRAFIKYGIKNFTFEVIEECAKSALNEREKYWIDYYDSFYNGYNQTAGGNYAPHFIKLTPKTLQEITKDLQSAQYKQFELAQKYHVSEEIIQGINTGRYWKREGLNYPLGRTSKKRTKRKRTGEKSWMSKDYKCPRCGAAMSNNAKYCKKCYTELSRKVERPDAVSLAAEIVNSSFSAVARKYGVSDTAIRNWCTNYGLVLNKIALYDYVAQENPSLLTVSRPKEKKKPLCVGQYTLQGELVQRFKNTRDASHQTGILHIKEVCDEKRKTSGGYMWKYID